MLIIRDPDILSRVPDIPWRTIVKLCSLVMCLELELQTTP